ncbi:MAG: hypothetical protein P8X95_15750 [Anaerolineales bacterium]
MVGVSVGGWVSAGCVGLAVDVRLGFAVDVAVGWRVGVEERGDVGEGELKGAVITAVV